VTNAIVGVLSDIEPGRARRSSERKKVQVAAFFLRVYEQAVND
jgi:hypothetical protein